MTRMYSAFYQEVPGGDPAWPAKTPLRPRSDTWIRDRRPSRPARPRFGPRSTSRTTRTLPSCSPRRLAVCPSLSTWSRGAHRDQTILFIFIYLSEPVSDAEMDAIAFCAPGGSGVPCEDRMMPEGLITAASFARAEDDSWIQVLGRLSPTSVECEL